MDSPDAAVNVDGSADLVHPSELDEVFLKPFGLSLDMHILRLDLILDAKERDFVRLRVERYVTRGELQALAEAVAAVQHYSFQPMPTVGSGEVA
jgi:hypothetical protein